MPAGVHPGRVVGHTGASIKELQAQFAGLLKGVYGEDRLSSHISAVAIVAAADSYISGVAVRHGTGPGVRGCAGHGAEDYRGTG